MPMARRMMGAKEVGPASCTEGIMALYRDSTSSKPLHCGGGGGGGGSEKAVRGWGWPSLYREPLTRHTSIDAWEQCNHVEN